MAAIYFSDPTPTQLDNGLILVANGVASRFASWVPFTRRVGETATALGTGVAFAFTFRIDTGASFEMRDIPNTHQALVLRFMRHMQGGGQCTVDTGDSAGRQYFGCILDPQAPDMRFTPQDQTFLTFSLSLRVISLNNVDMICEY